MQTLDIFKLSPWYFCKVKDPDFYFFQQQNGWSETVWILVLWRENIFRVIEGSLSENIVNLENLKNIVPKIIMGLIGFLKYFKVFDVEARAMVKTSSIFNPK